MNNVEGEPGKISLLLIILPGLFVTSFSQTILKGTVRDAASTQWGIRTLVKFD